MCIFSTTMPKLTYKYTFMSLHLLQVTQLLYTKPFTTIIPTIKFHVDSNNFSSSDQSVHVLLIFIQSLQYLCCWIVPANDSHCLRTSIVQRRMSYLQLHTKTLVIYNRDTDTAYITVVELYRIRIQWTRMDSHNFKKSVVQPFVHVLYRKK